MTTTAFRIAIVGEGNVGRALASRLQSVGQSVCFGVRSLTAADIPQSVAPRLLTPDAVRSADIVFLAVPAHAAVDALAHAELGARLVVDCTNPVRWDNGPVVAAPQEGSVAQQLAAAYPTARVFKAFNHFGAEIHASPALRHGAADVFVAGDDADGKATVMALASDLGFSPRDAGPLRNAALLENMAVLWIHLATVGGHGRQFAFRMESRAE